MSSPRAVIDDKIKASQVTAKSANETDELREELRASKAREWIDKARFRLGIYTLICTGVGFAILVGQMLVNDLTWPQLSGILGVALIWLCIVAVVAASAVGRTRR